MLAERDAAIAERDQALSQNDRLRHLLQQLQRMQFGSRSEKLDPDQLALAGGRAPRLRQNKSKPLVVAIRAWFEHQLTLSKIQVGDG